MTDEFQKTLKDCDMYPATAKVVLPHRHFMVSNIDHNSCGSVSHDLKVVPTKDAILDYIGYGCFAHSMGYVNSTLIVYVHDKSILEDRDVQAKLCDARNVFSMKVVSL